jgi:hypothetical protein
MGFILFHADPKYLVFIINKARDFCFHFDNFMIVINEEINLGFKKENGISNVSVLLIYNRYALFLRLFFLPLSGVMLGIASSGSLFWGLQFGFNASASRHRLLRYVFPSVSHCSDIPLRFRPVPLILSLSMFCFLFTHFFLLLLLFIPSIRLFL